MSKLEFTCPKCGGHSLNEIMVGVCVITEIIGFDDYCIDYDDAVNKGGHIESFCCENCGWYVRNNDSYDLIDCHDDLIEWIKEHDNAKSN